MGNGCGIGNQQFLITKRPGNMPEEMRATAMEVRKKRVQETMEVDWQDLVTDKI